MATTWLAGDITRYSVTLPTSAHGFTKHSSMPLQQTIAGGSGAGPTWHGTSGVHTHITNTRIGDVEILERRYPVIVHQFGMRAGSGGKGRWRGGDGVVREIEFLEPLQVSILSERRTRQPYGLEGGGSGGLGRNTWVKQPRKDDGDWPEEDDENGKRKGDEERVLKPRKINIGGKATVFMGKGDRLLIETPGAGAWGAPEEQEGRHDGQEHVRAWAPRGSSAEREAAQAAF